MFSDPMNVQQRLDLIEGFSSNSNIKKAIPTCINHICLEYKSNAIKWIIKNEDLKSLLSIKNFKIHHKYLEIDTFIFSLSLENRNNHIIFSIDPLQTESQCRDRIYCELYCIETQTQFKRTHLFKFKKRIFTKSEQENPHFIIPRVGKVESCAWPDTLLNISQCKNKSRLTFSAHINILDESQRNPVPMSPSNKSFRIEYKWDLDRYYDILYDTSTDTNTKECKVYSPNFMDDCWCLWVKNAQKSRNNDQDLYIFGLQLLKLPLNYRQGILFEGKFTYGIRNSDGGEHDPIKFAYYVDYKHQDIEFRNIKNASWVKIEIIMQ